MVGLGVGRRRWGPAEPGSLNGVECSIEEFRVLRHGVRMAAIGAGLAVLVGCGDGPTKLVRACPPLEVLERIAYTQPEDDVSILRDPSVVPTFEEVKSCLSLREDARRVLAAWYFLYRGFEVDQLLVEEMLASSAEQERAFGLEYLVRKAPDLEKYWSAIAVEQDPVVVEVSLEHLVLRARYTGDRRLLAALRRVVGVREGRPMVAIDVLKRLIPSAGVSVKYDPERLVEAWKAWLDQHASVLTWDQAKGVFTRG